MSTRLTVNIQRASELAGVAKRTMYYWLHSGRIEFTRTARGLRIFTDTLGRIKPAESTRRIKGPRCETWPQSNMTRS